MLNAACSVVDNIDTTKSTHQKFVVGRYSEARHHLVLEGMVVCRTMELLLGTVEQTSVGG